MQTRAGSAGSPDSGRVLEVLAAVPGGIQGDLGKGFEGDLLSVCALQQRHFASFS